MKVIKVTDEVHARLLEAKSESETMSGVIEGLFAEQVIHSSNQLDEIQETVLEIRDMIMSAEEDTITHINIDGNIAPPNIIDKSKAVRHDVVEKKSLATPSNLIQDNMDRITHKSRRMTEIKSEIRKLENKKIEEIRDAFSEEEAAEISDKYDSMITSLWDEFSLLRGKE